VAEFTRRGGAGRRVAPGLGPPRFSSSEEQHGEWELTGVRSYDGYAFLADQAQHLLKRHYKVHSLDGFGCAGMSAAVGAAGAILHYLGSQMRRDLAHIGRPRPWIGARHVLIDASSQANLELTQCRAGTKHTLLHALDRTRTPMGARTLRDWVLRPLRDLETLQARQGLIGAMVAQSFVLNSNPGRTPPGARLGTDRRSLEPGLGQSPGHADARDEFV